MLGFILAVAPAPEGEACGGKHGESTAMAPVVKVVLHNPRKAGARGPGAGCDPARSGFNAVLGVNTCVMLGE